jgi:predicted ATP-grasp superfamily ATP-dependent carboligase
MEKIFRINQSKISDSTKLYRQLDKIYKRYCFSGNVKTDLLFDGKTFSLKVTEMNIAPIKGKSPILTKF